MGGERQESQSCGSQEAALLLLCATPPAAHVAQSSWWSKNSPYTSDTYAGPLCPEHTSPEPKIFSFIIMLNFRAINYPCCLSSNCFFQVRSLYYYVLAASQRGLLPPIMPGIHSGLSTIVPFSAQTWYRLLSQCFSLTLSQTVFTSTDMQTGMLHQAKCQFSTESNRNH